MRTKRSNRSGGKLSANYKAQIIRMKSDISVESDHDSEKRQKLVDQFSQQLEMTEFEKQ